MADIPKRKFGKTDALISCIGFGGHHIGDAPDVKTAVKLVHQAVDAGITFFDNCWEYHRGKTEDWMGAGLEGTARQGLPDDARSAPMDATRTSRCGCSSSR